jgi:hypothetical protein
MPAFPSPASATDAEMAAIERMALAVGRLDARVSATFLGPAWMLRACWTGYARALQLMGTEIDAIDVFSWGCGLPLPDRAVRRTHGDDYAAFAPWQARLGERARHWAEDLPFSLPEDALPGRRPLVERAIDLLGLWLAKAPGIEAWLALPILLHRLGMTHVPLPCLVAGDRRLTHAPADRPARRRLVDELAGRAEAGLAALDGLERSRAIALDAIASERRPGALSRLLPLMLTAPIQTPEGIARTLGLTLSGAGKLLDRAARLGFAAEISGRRSWRVYASRDVGVQLGLVDAPRGRPPALRPREEEIGDVVAAFDREMADLARRFPDLLGEAGD